MTGWCSGDSTTGVCRRSRSSAPCSVLEEGGACGLNDPDCLARSPECMKDCFSASTQCPLNRGPGENGCYWEPGVWEGPCGHFFSSSVHEKRGWLLNFSQAGVGQGLELTYHNPNAPPLAAARCVRP